MGFFPVIFLEAKYVCICCVCMREYSRVLFGFFLSWFVSFVLEYKDKTGVWHALSQGSINGLHLQHRSKDLMPVAHRFASITLQTSHCILGSHNYWCVPVNVYVHVGVCTGPWVGYSVHMHMKARGQNRVCSCHSLSGGLKTGSVIEVSSPAQSGWLASKPPRTLLFPIHQNWKYKGTQPCPIFFT